MRTSFPRGDGAMMVQQGHSADTVKSDQIQHSSEFGQVLQSYISRAANLPWSAYRMRTAGTIPKELRGLVMQAVKLGKTWSCWTDGTQTRLFTAEVSLPLSRKRGAPVLQVNLYGEDGSLRESGTLMTDQSGKWCRCVD
jgi:hypothetical protein